jgi:hypothetical protein
VARLGIRIAALQLASQRRASLAYCAHCGRPMVAIRTRVYCSPSCRQMAYLARHRRSR